MGGSGSGRWHCEATRTTGEACLRVSADKLTRDKGLDQIEVVCRELCAGRLTLEVDRPDDP
mgnify:CR=1 FL=1